MHENRIRQAASFTRVQPQYCINEAVNYAKERMIHVRQARCRLNQAIQFPLAELHTEAEPCFGP